jgi:redox-sensing transcriptional repressor
MAKRIPRPTILRLTEYLRYLQYVHDPKNAYVSSNAIAKYMDIKPIVVKKDLTQATSIVGIPKRGYDVKRLVQLIFKALGYHFQANAIIVGGGKLGAALSAHKRFSECGLNIVAAFDIDPQNSRKLFDDAIEILNVDQLIDYVKDRNIDVGIVTVPKQNAQDAADLLVKAGIKAIWNFAPIHLHLPKNIVIKNEDMAASLAILSNDLHRH